ncbi:MAG: acetoin utilization protein AcuC [Carbonactinosporaceae bacterium]
MSRSLRVVWDDAFVAYDFGPGHPMRSVRVDLTIRLARELGLLDRDNVTVASAEPAGDDLLGLVHETDYIEAVRAVTAGLAGGGSDAGNAFGLRYGLGTPDNPLFPRMHEASARVAAATVAAAEAVWSGEADHGVNVAGGLHHALPGMASGFCIYNDPAIAIARLLEAGAERVAYVDVDVHHGDGVQQVFYDDPRVLTISLHESGESLFPGTGFPDELGGPKAEGSSVNVALPAGTGDEGWLRAFHSVVPHLLAAFRPAVLVSQHGCDSHFLDPLAHLTLSVDGQRAACEALHRLAHEHAGGRWVATGGGGYELVQVVPRTWSHLIAEAAGSPVDPESPVPEAWRAHVELHCGEVAPLRMTDGHRPEVRDWRRGYDPVDPLDRSILATRQAVFPAHGLDPMVDL